MRKYVMAFAASALAVCAGWAAFPQAGEATVQSGGERYAAIATRYSGSVPYRGGTAANAASRQQAAQRALAACGGPDCVLVLEFSGRGCGVYQASNDGRDYAWGWSMEEQRGAAEAEALRQCQSQLHAGERCVNKTLVCNTRGGAATVIFGKENESNNADGDDEDDWF